MKKQSFQSFITILVIVLSACSAGQQVQDTAKPKVISVSGDMSLVEFPDGRRFNVANADIEEIGYLELTELVDAPPQDKPWWQLYREEDLAPANSFLIPSEEFWQPGIGTVRIEIENNENSCTMTVTIIPDSPTQKSLKMIFRKTDGPCDMTVLNGWLTEYQTEALRLGYDPELLEEAISKLRTLARLNSSKR